MKKYSSFFSGAYIYLIFEVADTQESPKAPNEATGQGRPRALRVPHKTAPVSSSSSEDNYGKQIFYGKDNNTFTSHSK